MYFGLARTIAVFLYCLLFACASTLREPNSKALSTDKTESKSSSTEGLSNSGGRTVQDEEVNKFLSLKSILRKKRDMKYSTVSAERPTLASLRTVLASQRPDHGEVGAGLAWDSNTGVPLTNKPPRNNHAFGRVGHKRRVCFQQQGIIICKRARKAKMNNGVARNLQDVAATSSGKVTDSALAREIFEYEVEALRNQLQAMRQENIEELLEGDVNHLRPLSQVGGDPATSSGEQKRSELASLVDSDEKARPRFYPNDGPKRDWKVNLMRVWG
jgi:hypothetical protein